MSSTENAGGERSLITEDNLIKDFAGAIFSKGKELIPAATSIIELGSQLKQSDHPSGISPYFNAVSKIYAASTCVRELFEIRNQVVFLNSIRHGNMELEGFAKRQEALRQGEKWIYHEVERMAVYLSSIKENK